MPFTKVLPEKLSAAVIQQIELLILRGILRPGDRLPAERELSEKLGVSRPSLRTALANLSDRGLLISKAGSGVTVSNDLGFAISPALCELFSAHDEALIHTLDFRVDMEGLAAERAALLASDTDRKVINAIFQKMKNGQGKASPADEAKLDAEFHMAIIEASHNVIMLHMMRAMFQLLQDGVFYNRETVFRRHKTRTSLLEQHSAINDAIQARNPGAARRAVQIHLDFVKQALNDEQVFDQNESIAKLKYGRELSH